jgi:hypothetical protein
MWREASVTDAAGREIYRSGATDEYGDPVEGTVTYGTRWRDAAGNPTDRLWEAAAPLADHRVPAGSSVVESYRVPLPPGTQGPLRVRATLNSRAASGYLSSLMTIYLGDQVSLSPVVEMAATEADLQP